MTESESSAPPPATADAATAKASAAGAKQERRKAGTPNALPVLGGRLLLGIALLFGIAAVSPQGMNSWLDRKLHPNKVKPSPNWSIGTEADVEVTLITADARRLHCAHDEVFEGLHCGYGST